MVGFEVCCVTVDFAKRILLCVVPSESHLLCIQVGLGVAAATACEDVLVCMCKCVFV